MPKLCVVTTPSNGSTSTHGTIAFSATNNATITGNIGGIAGPFIYNAATGSLKISDVEFQPNTTINVNNDLGLVALTYSEDCPHDPAIVVTGSNLVFE